MQTKSPQEEKLFAALDAKACEDVPIHDLFKICYPERAQTTSVRNKQQRLGSLIARLNKKLNGFRVVPGVTKQTYRVQPTKTKT